ncbi:hypothetical protein NHX12_023823 [Muraenolepis orangiensis]|uniref:Uncharacterized protein n=1 Tax=Muraenolepis orangiensis TaxID=630683 RepID=A0A9Q0EL28_9TELE|nr:hypothetical protein NHX12_023823 [Muraenolepis orangiensis]
MVQREEERIPHEPDISSMAPEDGEEGSTQTPPLGCFVVDEGKGVWEGGGEEERRRGGEERRRGEEKRRRGEEERRRGGEEVRRGGEERRRGEEV